MKKHNLCFLFLFLLPILTMPLVVGCSNDKTDSDTQIDSDTTGKQVSQAEPNRDSVEIQKMFDEAAARWQAGDFAVLYDLEFEYLRSKYTFDEYVEFRQISYLEADTLDSFNVLKIDFFDRDSAHAEVEAVFVGPTGDTSSFVDSYRLYHDGNKWIHPTVSVPRQQRMYDSLRRIADSAAAADAELE